VTIFRVRVLDTPTSPFAGGTLRSDDDCGLLVGDGVITARGPFDVVRAEHPDEPVLDLRQGLLLPGLVDTHVHFPQVRVIGGLGLPLLDWLDRYALPEEMRLADVDHARGVARDFVAGLVDAGTTTALVFGAHQAPAVDVMFEAADHWGLRVTTGLVTSDRLLPEPLLTTPERAYAESRELAGRWHGKGRLRYAVTPRFSLSASEGVLEACAATFSEVPGSFAFSQTFRERVQQSVVHAVSVTLPRGQRARVVLRRDEAGTMFTQVLGDASIDLSDPAVAAVVDAAEDEVRDAVGLPR